VDSDFHAAACSHATQTAELLHQAAYAVGTEVLDLAH
jgi:hypothetical protein